MLGFRRRNKGPKDGYKNRPMTRDEAVDLAGEAGLHVADRDPEGLAIPRSTRVELRPNGKGFDLAIPAEQMLKLYDVGFAAGLAAGLAAARKRPLGFQADGRKP